MRALRIVLVSVLGSAALAAVAVDEADVRRITPEERAQLGPSQLLFATGWTPNLVHSEMRSAYDPTEIARDASLAGSAGFWTAAAGLTVAVVGVGLAAGIIELNEPLELRKLRLENAKGFATIRAALGDYDCRVQMARELDWQLSAAHPWLKIERVRITEHSVRGLAQAYAQEPVDTLIVVDARCGLSIDLGDARIDVSVEVFSKRFGPLAHAIEREGGEPAPALWYEEPVYRNRFVGRVSMPTAEISAARVAAREAEIDAIYGPRLAEARTKQQRADIEKRRKSMLGSAKMAGRISYNEYLELAREHWLRGEPTELQRALEQATTLVAKVIAEDLDKPPEPKIKRKKLKQAWVQKRPVVLKPKDD